MSVSQRSDCPALLDFASYYYVFHINSQFTPGSQ